MSDSTSPAAVAHEPDRTSQPRWYVSGPAIVAYIAAAKLLLHLFFASRYGYFRDELYYIACSRHLDWGYVDQPPLIAVVTWLELHVGGTSLLSLRFLPAVAGAGLAVLTAVLAREMGARRFGMGFAALCTASVGINFVMQYLLTMNAFEPLLWTSCAYVVVRIVNTGNQKLWLWFGLLAGIGLENKYSMAIFGFGVVVGLLLTEQRRVFTHKWIWLGGLVAFLVFLPNLIWNVRHDWPFVELMRNIRASGRDVELGPLSYIGQQIFIVNPILFPVWLVGLLYLFFGQQGKRYRALAWAYVVTLVVMIVMKGKNYYLAPAYPMLLAAGAIAIEGALEHRRQVWLKPAVAALVLAGTLPLFPLGLPVLRVEETVRYLEKFPVPLPHSEKGHLGAALPQYYADQFGWEEMTATVARIYQALPPEQRAHACIGASNFGEAGAIDFFGGKYGLPNAISGHQNYFFWGPGNCTGELLILLGERPERWYDRCEQVEIAAKLYHPYGILFENRPVLICRHLKADLRQVWPKYKGWD